MVGEERLRAVELGRWAVEAKEGGPRGRALLVISLLPRTATSAPEKRKARHFVLSEKPTQGAKNLRTN